MRKSGQPWSPEEEEQMLESFRKGKSVEAIATIHGRSPKAIRLRFGYFCKRQLRIDPESIPALVEEYNVDANTILNIIKELETGYSNNNGNNVVANNTISLSDITTIKDDISEIQRRLGKLSKTLKSFIEKTEHYHHTVTTILKKSNVDKNEIRRSRPNKK